MKVKTINLLRGGVFSLAVVAAFAFTTPKEAVVGYGAERNALDQVIEWHEVDLTNPQNYECDESSLGCIYEEANETSTMLEDGTFKP
jgi:hypothetical protein